MNLLLLLILLIILLLFCLNTSETFKVMPNRNVLAWIHQYGRHILSDNTLTETEKMNKILREYSIDQNKQKIQNIPMNLYDYDGYTKYHIWH